MGEYCKIPGISSASCLVSRINSYLINRIITWQVGNYLSPRSESRMWIRYQKNILTLLLYHDIIILLMGELCSDYSCWFVCLYALIFGIGGSFVTFCKRWNFACKLLIVVKNLPCSGDRIVKVVKISTIVSKLCGLEIGHFPKFLEIWYC